MNSTCVEYRLNVFKYAKYMFHGTLLHVKYTSKTP